MQWISRVVGGWNVRMTRNGKRHSKFFADTGYRGKAGALKAAKAYRDELAAIRQSRMRPPSPRTIVVNRGSAAYLQIRIPQGGGASTTTEFSIRRHGMRKAKQLAIAAFKASQA